MNGLKGCKMSFPGLSLVIALSVFLLQVGAAAAGAPDACEEPCDEESARAESPVVPDAEIDLTVQPQEAEQASAPGSAELTAPTETRLLPVHLQVPTPRGGIAVARGALGYRVPLVVRHRVPAQILGGVYMPEHETYVVLQPGYWEALGTAENPTVDGEAAETPQAPKGCWLRRLFRKWGRCDGGS